MLSVAQATDLIEAGDADGRFLAVGGYWYAYFLPCPYQPHIAPLAERCGFGVLTDAILENPFGGPMGPDVPGRLSPAIVPESAASLGITGNEGPMVVAIVHVPDDRSWQCAAGQRAFCLGRPVLDRIVWADGHEIDPAQFQPDITTSLTRAAASAAASAATGGGETVLAYPLDAATLNDVDPQFIGLGSGVVWYARVLSGSPDPNGTVAGANILIDDATGDVIAQMSVDVDPGYLPARVVLDSNGVSGPDRQTRYSISVEDRIFAEGFADSSSTPLVLAPGDYLVTAWGSTGAITHPPTPPSCDLPLSLAAGDDVALYADWPGGADCTWKAGEWPFN